MRFVGSLLADLFLQHLFIYLVTTQDTARLYFTVTKEVSQHG